MTIQDIEAFVAVVESGSVVAASAQLHLTQPAVTRRIQNLEQSLGEPLFDRNSKPQRPTAAGRKALGLARGVLAAAADFKHAFGPDLSAGEFRFGATPRMTELGLVDAVANLRRSYPKLVLHASAAWSAALWEQLHAGSLDAAILALAPDATPPAGFELHRLGSLTGCVVAAAADSLPSTCSIARLAGRPWILNSDGCSMREVLKGALRSQGLPFDVGIEAGGVDLQLALVAKGAGLGLVSDEMLQRSPHRSALRVIRVKDFKPRFDVCLVHRPGSDRLRGPLATLREAYAKALN